jgi:hypothetical protein
MKQILSISIILLFKALLVFSQDKELPKVVKDTLFTSSGYNIVVGQDVNFGTGSTPDGDFKFIRRNSTGFGTMMIMTNDNSYNKSQLSMPRNMSNHKAKVVKIVTRGTKKTGITYEPLIAINGVRYEIDVDNAISTGEMIVPDAFRPQKNNSAATLSKGDEIKKLKDLLDSGAITQDEYNAAKKKVLDQ